MMKRFFRSALATALILLCAAIAAACNKKHEDAGAEFGTIYDIVASLDGDAQSLSLIQNVTYTNSTGGDLVDLRFHLYPNAFAEGASSKPYLDGEAAEFFPDGEDFGGIEILSVTIDGQTSDFELCGTDDSILAVPLALGPGRTTEIGLECLVDLPRCVSRFGVNSDTVNLTGFYPVVCLNENGSWREDAYSAIGDPFFTDAADYYVTLSYPSDYTLAASGERSVESSGDGVTTADFFASDIRDFAAVLSKDFEFAEKTKKIGERDVRVEYYSLGGTAPDDGAALAADILTVFSDAFGGYPYSTFTAVEAPINSGGMEYGAFVVLSSALKGAALEETLAHEAAHQWWYGAVGSDQINAAWLDESLTEFCTAYYYLLKGDGGQYTDLISATSASYLRFAAIAPEAFNAVMERPVTSFLTNGEYAAVVYARGAMMFDSVLAFIGRDKMNRALSDYYKANRFKIATKDALVAAFAGVGYDVSGLLDSWLNDKVLIG